jgi:hypothetical protein
MEKHESLADCLKSEIAHYEKVLRFDNPDDITYSRYIIKKELIAKIEKGEYTKL